jgi:hypothetical protein
VRRSEYFAAAKMPESAAAAMAVGVLTAAGVLVAGGCSIFLKGNDLKARSLPRHFSSRGAAKKHGAAGRSELIVAENVDEYRGAIASAVRDGDTVLEIGCHEGMTTYLLACCCGTDGLVVGADKSAHWLARAKARFPAVRFELIDCFDMGALLQLQLDIGRPFSVIFVDVSGSRELRSLIPLVEALECALGPEMIVVKSFRLAQLQRRLQAASEYISHGMSGVAPPTCRAGSSAEVASRTTQLGSAMRRVQNERRRRVSAPLSPPNDDAVQDVSRSRTGHQHLPDQAQKSAKDSPSSGSSVHPCTINASTANVCSEASLTRPNGAGHASNFKRKSGAEWSAVCWVCGVAKQAKAFSVRQQRQANSGTKAQCKQCVAARRHSSNANQTSEKVGT